MNKFKYRFTIFTPCYNSEKFLERVYRSVKNQTYRNFEWLIINDASTDGTAELIKKYEKLSDFPIRVINNPENKMLYYNFNTAFDEAQGELMIFAGHDDAFDEITLERFNKVWEEYGSDEIAGIWCRCRDQHGNIIGSSFPNDLIISSYHEMFEKHIYGSQERFVVTQTKILRENKFDLTGYRTGEVFLWSDIGMKYKTIYMNDVLRTYYIESENSSALTKRGRKKIALETYLYYIEFLNRYITKVPNAYFLKARFHFATVYYGIISDKPFYGVIKDIKMLFSKIFCSFLYPIAFLVAKKNND